MHGSPESVDQACELSEEFNASNIVTQCELSVRTRPRVA